MCMLFGCIEKIVLICVSVMIVGESGVGKDIVVCWLYDLSVWCDGLFVLMNCGVILFELVEV